MSDSREMPRYKSHKQVWALKIKSINFETNTIVPEDKGYGAFNVSPEWIARNQAAKDFADGYFVVYDDGYASYSPTKAFEEGYVQVSGPRNEAMTGYDDGEMKFLVGTLNQYFAMVYAQKFLAKPGEQLLSPSAIEIVYSVWKAKLKEHFRTIEDAPKFCFEYTPGVRGLATAMYAEFVQLGRKPLQVE